MARTALEEKIGQFNTNWRLCGIAEMAHDWLFLDKMNAEHKKLIEWFRERGITFNDLAYNRETSTFSLPTGILSAAST